MRWTIEDRAQFDGAMNGYWQGWQRVSVATKALYVERLEVYGLPLVREALKAVKGRQEVERVPGLQAILERAAEEQRHAAWRQRGQADRTGGVFRTPAEADLAKLAAACVEIADAKGLWWRFIHMRDEVTAANTFGLSCAVTSTFIPLAALPADQQERLRLEGLQVMYDRQRA